MKGKPSNWRFDNTMKVFAYKLKVWQYNEGSSIQTEGLLIQWRFKPANWGFDNTMKVLAYKPKV